MIRSKVWDIDSKVINVQVRVNPETNNYDLEEVANCSINLDYMSENPIKVLLYHKQPSQAKLTSRSLLWHSNIQQLLIEVRQCVWWNPDFGTKGAWDPYYCKMINTSATVTYCSCTRYYYFKKYTKQSHDSTEFKVKRVLKSVKLS